jgi:hypothetical protein
MSPPAAIVVAGGGVAVPELRSSTTEEHNDTSWVSWVLVGEQTLGVVWDLVLLLYDIWQGKPVAGARVP